VFTDIQGGGNGGRPYADGAMDRKPPAGVFMIRRARRSRQRFPIRIERYEFVPTAAAPDANRGSLALRRISAC